MIYIKGRIIDTINSNHIEDGLVIIENDKIKYVGLYDSKLIPENTNIYSLENGSILPGFIDCHVHLNGSSSAQGNNSDEYKLLCASKDMNELLNAGFITLRDMSFNGFSLSKAVENNILKGPRIIPGGRVLSCTGGHGDMGAFLSKTDHNKYYKDYRLCDGIDDCLLATREQFREGAKFIKICATGGVSSLTDGLDDIQFSQEEIKAIVEEAERHNTYVTAHCTGNEGMLEAIKAGVRCIEHGVMANQETVNLMAKYNIPLVSTLSVSLMVAGLPGLHPLVAKKASHCAKANLNTVKMAKEAGIMFVLGTDYSNTNTTPYKNNGREFAAMVEAGLSNMEAIKAGTINGAKLLNMEDQIGSIAEGKLADLVLVEENPLENIICLSDEKHIKLVIKSGMIEKNILD